VTVALELQSLWSASEYQANTEGSARSCGLAMTVFIVMPQTTVSK
jgi:hypothetical protein